MQGYIWKQRDAPGSTWARVYFKTWKVNLLNFNFQIAFAIKKHVSVLASFRDQYGLKSIALAPLSEKNPNDTQPQFMLIKNS